jgi:hypothetical protein
MKKLLLFVFLFISCQTGEKKKEVFNLVSHLKSNEWCAFLNQNQRCFTFTESKMIISENGISKAEINVMFNLKSDSIVVVKVIGEQEFENHFRMKSMDTLYFSQGDENKMLVEFLRIK